ncbi:hypothetical protein M2347_003657 [Chryseobacterium sp. H1D6B]|uniref:hypothetical protein n=1 Tax=Chryseobacterium sp. H1D6B TaxID=2940588 RepID=UPI0015CA8D29|nr:hypothetical protein [Chryseobacterium sp. H1D6B]MDH6253930.1 hypothetical protein [Chryseobacterium sp. H1D6B]
MKQLFFYLSILLFFSSCATSKKSDHSEISSKITKLFKSEKSSDPIPLKDLISSDLKNILDEVTNVSNADAERVKKSDHPTDKPSLIEGSIFTGTYDGATKYTVKKIIINGDIAEAVVELEDSGSSPTAKWEDTVYLINENGWKIDNIIFPEKVALKNKLKDFISETKKGFQETAKK